MPIYENGLVTAAIASQPGGVCYAKDICKKLDDDSGKFLALFSKYALTENAKADEGMLRINVKKISSLAIDDPSISEIDARLFALILATYSFPSGHIQVRL